MAGLTALDMITLLLVGGGLVFGFLRGFVAEVLSLFAWVGAVLALRFFHEPATEWLAGSVGTFAGAAVLAFALLFGGALVIGKMLAGRMGRATRQSVVGPIDRVLGGGFGAVKGLIGATLLYLAANLAYDTVYGPEAPRPEWMATSRTYPLLHASGQAIISFVGDYRAYEAEPDESANEEA